MAPKRAAAKAAPPPPPAESSDDETQSRSRSEDSEDEEALAESPIPAPTPVLKNTPAPSQKGDESESSDEEEEEEPAPAAPKNQPPPPQKKDDSDASGSDEEEDPTRTAPPSSQKKQPQKKEDPDTSGDEEDEDEDEDEEEEAPPPKPAPKKEAPPPKPAPKKEAEVPKPPAAAETKKPGAFERIWSTNDDVRILEALAAHQKQHGTLPQPEALVDVLAGKLDKPSYGSKELQNKVKSLRTRYLILSKRGQLPSKDHDRRVLDLSKLVWTSDNLTSPVAVADAAANAVNRHEPKGFQEMCELYPHLAEEVKGLEAAHPGMCKREFGKMDDDKARAMDQKIKKQRVMQIKVEMRHADLIKEVTKALLDLVDS